jgi:hypothetical protein
MDGMDDAAFARMLQQQLRDEELMMAQQQQPKPHRHSEPAQTSPGQPLPPAGTRQHSASPTGSNYQQPPRSNYQEPSPPGNHRQPYPNSDYQQPPPSGYLKSPPPGNYNQPPPDNYQQNHNASDPYQQKPPPQSDPYARPPPQNNDQYQQPQQTEDADLALARRLQMLETTGQASQIMSVTEDEDARLARHMMEMGVSFSELESTPQDSSASGGGASGGTRMSKQEHEAEDSRLARLMMETGQSLRDLDLAPARSAPASSNIPSIPQERIHDPPPQEPSRKPPPHQFVQKLPTIPIARKVPTRSSSPQVDSRLLATADPKLSKPRHSAGPPMSPIPSSPNAASRTAKEEREAEDSRLARLMMETGQSLRDLDLAPARSAPVSSNIPSIPQERTHAPPPQEPSRKPPPHQFVQKLPTIPIAPKVPTRSSAPQIDSRLLATTDPKLSNPRYSAGPPMSPMSRTAGTNIVPSSPNAALLEGMTSRKPSPMSRNITPSSPIGFDPSPLNAALLEGMTSRKPSPKISRKTIPKRNNSLPKCNLPLGETFLDDLEPVKKEKKKKRGIFGFGLRSTKSNESLPGAGIIEASVSRSFNDDDITLLPFPIPKPVARPADTIGATKGPLPYSLTVSKDIPKAPEATAGRRLLGLGGGSCSACTRPVSNPLTALDKKYHTECFRCLACHEQIDSTGPFAYIESNGDKQPMHHKCYAEMYGIKCAVCKKSIAAGPNGKISFVKHPFFDTEQMCPSHAKNMTRRCTGCHRFEPETEPFADLNDVGRCVCLSCCRSVVVDSSDAQPLWAQVIDFFDEQLKLPIWKDLREVPVLIVGYDALNDQMSRGVGNNVSVHGGASQIMTRGLCLTEHESGRRLRSDTMKFDKYNKSFVAADVEDRGFTFFQVPDASKVNPNASVTAILCLSGLPKDLTASVLAHEATHAWIKLHPSFNYFKPIPPQVEEGVAQLIALLFLNDGLDPAPPLDYNDGSGPSDEKLRQYFKFSIETDEHELYGTGFRRAAKAYSMIGIEALMSHIVLYQDFPET